MDVSKLCLIDANSLFYRAYFAVSSSLATSSGQPTNAVFGFVRMVNKILEELNPQYIAICFDVGKVTHRTKKFAEYKINRPAMPDALMAQVPVIKEVIRAYNFPIFELEGFEADDIIASIVRRTQKKVNKIVIVSSDKDILQLVSDNVEVYNPYKEEGIVFNEHIVKEKMGVAPERIKDLIALMGDSSDNIPGAHGIGEKTARELLKEFESVDGLLKNRQKIKREALKRTVEENLKSIRMSLDLAILEDNVPIDFKLDELKVKGPDNDKLWELFSRLEFKGMLKKLSGDRLSAAPSYTLEVARDKACDIQEVLKKARDNAFAFYINEDEAAQDSLAVNIACDEKSVCDIASPADLRKLFSGAKNTAIGFDVKKSLHALRRMDIEPDVKFFDCLIAAYLLQSSRSAQQLEGLIWDYLSIKGLSRLDYFSKESHFLLRLKDVLGPLLKERGLIDLFERVEMPLVGILFKMESAGVKIDRQVLKGLSQELEHKLKKLITSIYELAGCEFNINSPKQLSEVLFQKLKMPVIKKTKTGISTDEEVLNRLSQDHELPRILLEYRTISKLKTTYIDALPELADRQTGKIHSSFNQTGTETGRLSSSNPNLQNIPIKTDLGRRIRQAFVPSDGFDWLMSADYSQIELRILAHLSGDETLISAFKEGRDIHRHTASLIFSVDEKDVSDEMRENSKRVNFGIIYGMSSYGLAKDLGIDPALAQGFIDEYFMRYPKVKSYLESSIGFVKENGYCLTILGRRRYIPEISNSNFAVRQFAERQAVNAPIQGSAADLIKLAMVEIDRRLKSGDMRSRLILQVHDELVFEVRDDEKKDLIRLVRDGMENVMELKCPVKTDISIGKNWLDMGEI